LEERKLKKRKLRPDRGGRKTAKRETKGKCFARNMVKGRAEGSGSLEKHLLHCSNQIA
jgi:hypothetical protein